MNERRRTEAEGYQDGLASGQRVPREPDDTDRVHAGNFGGKDYATGFLRGVADAFAAKNGPQATVPPSEPMEVLNDANH